MKKIFNIKFKINKKIIIIIAIIVIALLMAWLTYYAYQEKKQCEITSNNKYNLAFNELINYVQNVEAYLAKSQISNSAKSGVENLTNVWREASNAQVCLSQLPLNSSELGNTSKFLNQVSDYSYTLSRKNLDGQNLSSGDMVNLKELYSYTVDMENTLNQLSTDLNDGKIKWSQMTSTDTVSYATQVSSIGTEDFQNLEKDLHEYSGLIYDGAFSDNLTSNEKKGLTGDDIDEEKAKDIANNFYGNDNIEKIETLEYSENADIPAYNITLKLKNGDTATISISKKGGHIILANCNKVVNTEILSEEQANEIGKAFLANHGYDNMKETYYLKENGVITINYAYKQTAPDGTDVVMYPDLIKLKIALDNGEVLGLEATNYLNSHITRDISNVSISKDQAKASINSNVDIESENLAVIPTKWKTEILCWEIKGKVDNNEFLVYVNAQTGKEEDILLIINTPNGTLTH